MGLLNRIRGMVNADVENPTELRPPAAPASGRVVALREELERTRKQLARSAADEERLKLDIEDHLAQAKVWQASEEFAREGGKAEAAEQAQVSRQRHEKRAQSLIKAWLPQRSVIAKLEAAVRSLEERLAEAERQDGRPKSANDEAADAHAHAA